MQFCNSQHMHKQNMNIEEEEDTQSYQKGIRISNPKTTGIPTYLNINFGEPPRQKEITKI